ncbi:hypothetical protein [Croceicoccus gelatinilyticus]|uniref:hypothetical protein n=1 Tax=Croceicoccus gelatinilyticus TaxID=2835536 RepID=UPI001BCFC615|nr:hypothetical protein [Croceicoccus gelatinilyticus]MBS7670733.1 hypothetical protein [Croceicoccus gelatinilyticus]
MNIKIAGACAALLALGACATYSSPEAGKFDPEDFGEANRMTYAAMVVDPDPEYDGPMEGDAEVAADAVTAYREGAVEEPEQQTGNGLNFGGNN